MIALIQRVSEARVEAGGKVLGRIGRGIVGLVGVERGDGEAEAARLAERVLGYRIFPDAQGRMNLPLTAIGGGLLAVPQFTLAADTAKGARPGFSTAAAPEDGARLFERFVALARASHPRVECGRFGAEMQVHLVNDGPVTFWLQAAPRPRP
jgi:D-tyrosyl-tRNA(Tyr) deacylase